MSGRVQFAWRIRAIRVTGAAIIGIDSVHPEYAARLPQWRRCIDAFDGTDAVKAKPDYLPRLGGQKEEDYQGYVARALFYGATSRTVQGFVGALVRVAPVAKVPAKFEPWLDALTPDGLPLTELVKVVASHILLTNRCGLLTERGPNDNDRPYIAVYDATSITNWDSDGLWFVLREMFYEADVKDKYLLIERTRYRELVLDGGRYLQNVWLKRRDAQGKEATEFTIDHTVKPTRRGQPLDAIPFTINTDRGQVKTVGKPPMLDMVDVNLSHYRNSADLEHGRHFTALPTPWVSGAPEAAPGQKQPELLIGSAIAWMLPNPQSRAGFLEFSGTGLGSLVTGMDKKEDLMARLGAGFLMQPRTGVETAETATIHRSGEVSNMTSLAISTENGIKLALESMVKWEGDASAVELTVNKDFLDSRMSAQEIAAAIQAFQAGGMSLDTFLWNLKQGEWLAPETSIEDEKAKIKLQAGSNTTALPLPGKPGAPPAPGRPTQVIAAVK